MSRNPYCTLWDLVAKIEKKDGAAFPKDYKDEATDSIYFVRTHRHVLLKAVALADWFAGCGKCYVCDAADMDGAHAKDCLLAEYRQALKDIE